MANAFLDDYIEIRLRIPQKYTGKYCEEYRKVAQDLLDHAYDWVWLQQVELRAYYQSNLEDYLWSNTRITHKELGFSLLFYWIMLRQVIVWISEQVFERLNHE